MYAALSKSFQEVTYKERYAFFHDVIGGLLSILETAMPWYANWECFSSTEFLFVDRKADTLETAK